MRRLPMLATFAVVFLAGCGGDDATESAATAPSATRWERAETPTDLAVLEAPARVVPAPGSVAHVSAPFVARVLAIHVRAGDRVEAGAPLLDVSMPEVLDAAARLASTSARRSLRAGRRAELETLQGEGLVEQGRVFEQDTELAALDAERAQALAVLHSASIPLRDARTIARSGRIPITTPIAGIVRDVTVALAETRDPTGAPMVEVVADLPARIEARFAQVPPVGATLLFVGLDGTTVPLASEPDAVVLDPDDGTHVVWLHPDVEHRLPAGMHGRVRVRLAGPDIVEIPAKALVLSRGHVFVERRSGEARPERVEVQVLTSTATRAIVRGPIAVGDEVSCDPTRSVEGGGGHAH